MSNSKITQEERETRELILETAKRCPQLDAREVKFVIQAFFQASLEHMAVHHKSIDFGFMVIHAIPYRANWKNYFLERFRWLGPALRRKSEVERESIMLQTVDVEGHMGYLLPVRRGLVHFTVEAVPKIWWWRKMLNHQRKLLRNLNPVKYCKYISRELTRLKPRLRHAYLSHLSQIDIPCGEVRSSRFFGHGEYLTAFIPKGRVRPSTAEVRLGPLVVYKTGTKLQSRVPEDPVGEENPGMLPVSTPESPVIDVRNGDE